MGRASVDPGDRTPAHDAFPGARPAFDQRGSGCTLTCARRSPCYSFLSGCSHVRPCSASCAEFFGDSYSAPTVRASGDAQRDEYGQTKAQRTFGAWFTGFVVLLFVLGLYYNGKGGGGTTNGNDAPTSCSRR